MYTIGIDPGKTGGVVCLDSEGNIKSYFIPKLIDTVFDTKAFNDYINEIKQYDILQSIYTYIEEVHSVYGASAKANHQFGKVCGIIEGIIVANNLSLSFVQPKYWQGEMLHGVPIIKKPGLRAKGRGSNDTKKMAEIAFHRMYPNVDFNITAKGNVSKNVHEGLVDAILIAEYGRRKLIGRRS